MAASRFTFYASIPPAYFYRVDLGICGSIVPERPAMTTAAGDFFEGVTGHESWVKKIIHDL